MFSPEKQPFFSVFLPFIYVPRFTARVMLRSKEILAFSFYFLVFIVTLRGKYKFSIK
jgi:hypothetical protein